VIPETIAPDSLLTSTQVGNLLQVNPSSVKKWVNDGHIIAFRTPGGHRRIRALDLVAFLDHHKIPVPRQLADAGKRRIVCVDDDVAQLRALGRSLKRWADKLDVILVDNGVDALLEVGAQRPHGLLIDVSCRGSTASKSAAASRPTPPPRTWRSSSPVAGSPATSRVLPRTPGRAASFASRSTSRPSWRSSGWHRPT
jgi:excisionase family DNA binding protein